MKYSIVVPVFRNEHTLPDVLRQISALHDEYSRDFEVVFVIDGSPDNSYALLKRRLPEMPFASQLVLSRNFGPFAAIRPGFAHAQGDAVAVLAADLSLSGRFRSCSSPSSGTRTSRLANGPRGATHGSRARRGLRRRSVRGYTPIMLAVLFSLSTMLLAVGILSGHVWRIFENTKGRPLHVVRSIERIAPAGQMRAAGEEAL